MLVSPEKDILVVGPLNDNARWLVTLTDKDPVIKVLSLVPIVKGLSFQVFSLTSSIVQCRTHWLPVYVPMADVIIHGIVQFCSWDYSKIPGYQHVKSTVRNIVLDMAPGTEAPSLRKIFLNRMEHKMLLTIPGCRPVCFRCQKIGRTSINCREVNCRHCQMYGQHITVDCPTPASYANRAKAEATRALETYNFPADNNERTTTGNSDNRDLKDHTQSCQLTEDPEGATGGATAEAAGATPNW